jgi:glycosyltransferase involved in cell wall biosynthesis
VASLSIASPELRVVPGAGLSRDLIPQGPIAAPRARVPSLAQMGLRVSVVIAALNEEQNLPYVFARLPEGLHELIVVDGHSTDNTVAAARGLWPDVRIVMQSGRGKGNALAEGFAACTGDIVVTLDADGSTDAAEIPRFVAALCNGADFVKGSRFAQGGASSDITRARSLGNRALNAIVNALYGTRYTDLCYGYNAFWARCLPYMRVDCDGFEVETLINVRIAKAGLVVHEVPSYERDRIHGMSNLNAVRDGTRVLRTIALERMSTASRRSILPRIAYRLLTR